MPGRERWSFVRMCFKDRFLFILIALLFYLGFSPFLKEFVGFKLLLDILFSIVFVSAVYAVSRTRRLGIIVTLLVLPYFFLTWTGYWSWTPRLSLATQIYALLVYFVIIVIVLQFFIRSEGVTRDVIYAAIVVYLLLGVLFSIIYSVLEMMVPGSFKFMDAQIKDTAYIFIYYSFVTLTTLGYGDVTPMSAQAGSLAILEALIGQLYLTVVIARLVGLHISSAATKKKE